MIKFVLAVLAALMLMASHASSADEGRRLPTIGLAIPIDTATDAPYQKAFRDGLRDLGYIDGKNVTFVVRHANGDPTALHALIQELIALRVDVLWGDAPALKEATATIPIVSPTMGDPVRTRLVASLARPGGNVTGLSAQSYEAAPKLLELSKELIPNLKRLVLLFDDSREPNLESYINDEFRPLAHSVGVNVRSIPVRTLQAIRAVPRTIDQERPQAVMIWASAFTYQNRIALIGSVAHRLPVIADGPQLAEAGAVLTYSVDWFDMFRRSAVYVDKILRGAKPADLPIEQPTKFKLVVNVKAAKTVGIKVPESMLAGADEVIR
jgi:putative ABC transport system substrate-binding protein